MLKNILFYLLVLTLIIFQFILFNRYMHVAIVHFYPTNFDQQSYLMMIRQGRNKGKSEEEIKNNFRNEVADVFSHVLLLAKFYKIDLEKEVEKKWLKWKK